MVKYSPDQKFSGNTAEDIQGAFEHTLRAEHPNVACTHHLRHGQAGTLEFTPEQKAAYASRLVNAITSRMYRVVGMDKDHATKLYANDPSNGGGHSP
jgi:hypothetical protein